LVNGVYFHNKNHPQSLKNDVIVREFMGSSPNYMTQIVLKNKKEAKDTNKKTKSFFFFEMLKEGSKFKRFFSLVFK